MNTATVAGRITDAGVKLRYTETTLKPELTLTVIHEEPGKDGHTFKTFLPVVIVGPRAEPLAEALEPGDMIGVSGKLGYRRVKTKTGEESKLVIVAFDAEVLAKAEASVA